MTLRELLKRKSFKSIFNVVYKNYLKEESEEKVINFSIGFENAFDELKSVEHHSETKNLIVLNEVERDGEQIIDVCLFDHDQDEHYSLDFMDWGEIIECNVIAPKKLNQTQIIGHILWEITFWGFSRDKIKHERDETIKSIEESEKLEVSSLEDFIKEMKEMENE
jgi:hypothetical protein